MHNRIIKTFDIQLTGVLHVGAHMCQEGYMYERYVEACNIHWVEANPTRCEEARTKFPRYNIHEAIVDDNDGTPVIFNIANNDGKSSSVLELGDPHKNQHPRVHFVDKIKGVTKRLDTLIDENNIPIESINYITLDVQGVELRALKSLGKYISNIEYVYAEVNKQYTYVKCDLVQDLDEYLDQYDFERVSTVWSGEESQAAYGNALYIKKSKNNS